MSSITFKIVGGVPNYVVSFMPDIGKTWNYLAEGEYAINDELILEGETYTMLLTDSSSCQDYKNVIIPNITQDPTTTTTNNPY